MPRNTKDPDVQGSTFRIFGSSLRLLPNNRQVGVLKVEDSYPQVGSEMFRAPLPKNGLEDFV